MGVTREGAWLEESGGLDQGGGVARGEVVVTREGGVARGEWWVGPGRGRG